MMGYTLRKFLLDLLILLEIGVIISVGMFLVFVMMMIDAISTGLVEYTAGVLEVMV